MEKNYQGPSHIVGDFLVRVISKKEKEKAEAKKCNKASRVS
jgi:hypothetical protein